MAHTDKNTLTLTQLAGYDDIITDVLVDHVYFWTAIRKNRARYFACRGIGDETIPKILQKHLILNEEPSTVLEKIIQLPPVRRYYSERLKSDIEREHFRHHLLRYIYMYSPDAPFEVSTTNRYLVDTHEAAVTARADIARGEVIRHLTGVQVPLTKDEEKTLDLTRRDFSVVISARKRTVSLFLGPARFANHDCDANARLRTSGNRGMEVIAVKDIKVGDEITVTYSEDYFGADNKECLCATCEKKERNGWVDDEEDGGRARREDSQLGPDTPSHHSRAGSRTASNSRSSSRKRKSDAAGLDIGDRSAKRPDFARVTETSSKRASSGLSNEIRPQDIPDSGHVVSNGENGSSPPVASASPSSKSSHADGISASTAPTSLSEQDQPPSRFRVERTNAKEIGRHRHSYQHPHDRSVSGRNGSTTPTARQDGRLAPLKESRILSGEVRHSEQLVSRLESASNEIGLPVIDTPAQEVADLDEAKNRQLPDTEGRRPGDYTLTARLLCTPYSRWVQCRVCEGDFVQTDAYQTRFACPRCERHSKLYGYMWPKTEKEGKFDDEERVLDHREVNRFVGAQEEKDIKKGKEKALKNLLRQREERVSSSAQDEDEWEDVTPQRGRVFRKSLGKRTFYGRDPEVDDSFSRRRRSPDLEEMAGLNPKRPKNNREENNTRVKKVTLHYRHGRVKRKYVRSGNYTREKLAERAERREAFREHLKQEKLQRRKMEKKKQQTAITNSAVIAKKPTPKVHQPVERPKPNFKPNPPPGAKASKWKGWVLVPATEDNAVSRKTYDSAGQRIVEKEEDNESESDSGPVKRSRQSVRASKPNQSRRNTAGSGTKRKYVRSGKYVGVAEARRNKRGIPPPANKKSTVTKTKSRQKARPRPLTPNKPGAKRTIEIKSEPPSARKPPPIIVDESEESSDTSSDADYESVLEGLADDSLVEQISIEDDDDSQSEVVPEVVEEPDSDFAYSDLEEESDFEGRSRNKPSSRRKSEPVRKSARARRVSSSAQAADMRSTRRASGMANERPSASLTPAPSGKLKRVKNDPRGKLPLGWAWLDVGEEKTQDQEDSENDMDWEAEATAVERAKANSSLRRSRKTM